MEWVNELSKRNASAHKVANTSSIEWLNKSIELEKKKDWPGFLKHALRWTQVLPGNAGAWWSL
ncbi:MAG: hypothetical protein J0653_01555, partial [Deltaproteobacteria bacterium]|nr:hypothetical protein [Deltaproteobacteria bacterium]